MNTGSFSSPDTQARKMNAIDTNLIYNQVPIGPKLDGAENLTDRAPIDQKEINFSIN
jgi:hypothetical protein